MDVILHLGAHRTGSTSFQHYMRGAAAELTGQGVGYWGPLRTRKGLFHGIAEGGPAGQTRRACGRVQLALAGARRRGVRQLLVSDENMMGMPRMNLRTGLLYPEAGLRMARFANAFGESVTRVVLTIRPLSALWASTLAYALPRGVPLPTDAALEALARSPRNWRDLIADLACALPDAEFVVLPFDDVKAAPERLLAHTCDGIVPPHGRDTGYWLNRSPDLKALRALLASRGDASPDALPEGSGRWMPFTEAQTRRLDEAYADDLFWLMAGADGLATWIEEDTRERDSNDLPSAQLERGRRYDQQDRSMAQTR